MKKPVTRMLAVVALLCLGMTTQADAGLRQSRLAAAKACDCAPTCQPDCCRPTIVKPCCPNVYTYQRQKSNLKPPCCGCAPGRRCKPRRGLFGRRCNTGTCCDATGTACDAGACGTGACATGACGTGEGACCPDGATAGCCPSGASCDGCYLSPRECCRLAELIYDSQTACYPKQRRRAVRKLGRKYDCECTPQVMAALIYALNDADPYVRETAANEIRKQVRNGCCCSPEVTQALTCALGDCHKKVAKNAEKALERCGYNVVDGNCDADGCCDVGCDGRTVRGRLKGLLARCRKDRCDDPCLTGCDDPNCCDGVGCGSGCSLGSRLRGLFKRHCGVDCCDNVGCCDDPGCDGCGSRCGGGLLSRLCNKHRCSSDCCDASACDGCGSKCGGGLLGRLCNKHRCSSDCCDATGCCDAGACDGCGCGSRHAFGSRLKGIFAKHRCGTRCDDPGCCDTGACDGCGCGRKKCFGGLRGLFKCRKDHCSCDGCCPTSCCTTGAQPQAVPSSQPAEVDSSDAAPAEPAEPTESETPDVAPPPPEEPQGEPQACRPVPRKNVVGHFGLAN